MSCVPKSSHLEQLTLIQAITLCCPPLICPNLLHAGVTALSLLSHILFRDFLALIIFLVTTVSLDLNRNPPLVLRPTWLLCRHRKFYAIILKRQTACNLIITLFYKGRGADGSPASCHGVYQVWGNSLSALCYKGAPLFVVH